MQSPERAQNNDNDDVVSILDGIMPNIGTILMDTDRILTAATNMSTNMIAPAMHSRQFPHNIRKATLDLLYQISKASNTSKAWKKDVTDAFNNPKFFSTPLDLASSAWLDLLRQWSLTDKERLPELLSRLSSPASAGIMFGVGASAARLEADRKTQLNLRRIATLVMSGPEDSFVSDLPSIQEKVEDLISATNISSPSSMTRADVFLLLRVLVLKTSPYHLAPLWPTVNSELQTVLTSFLPNERSDKYNPYSLLQACKLLDILLLLAPDEFQLQEWLFITDTIDAVYRPTNWRPVALADEISELIGSKGDPPSQHLLAREEIPRGQKRALLATDGTRSVDKDEIVERILRPFFAQLSIFAFESTYSMGRVDVDACKEDLLADLFCPGTIVG